MSPEQSEIMSLVLTKKQVKKLKNNTPVFIQWPGRTLAFEYFVIKGHRGERFAARNLDLDDSLRWYLPIVKVGSGEWDTHVWLREIED